MINQAMNQSRERLGELSKAMIAQAEGRITGSDVARAESHLNKGMPVPADTVVKVAG